MATKWILVADDEPELIQIYIEYFETIEGTRVISAKDGGDAYSKSRMQKFDCIITDYRMPRLNGVQLIGALRENPGNSNCPIYVITGFSDEVEKELQKAKLSHNVTVIQKPLSLNVLKGIVDKLVVKKEESAPPTVDVKFLNPYMKAVELTLKEMASLKEISAGKPFLLSDEQSLKVDISSNLAVISKYFSGNIVIGFPKETFLKVASEVLGEAQSEINKNNCDLVGELTNIIFGKAKTVWNEAGFSVQKAIPSVIEGNNHQIRSSKVIPSIVVPYQSNLGNFSAIISVLKEASH